MNAAWRDLAVVLPDRPGALADLGQALGGAGVSLEGGGVFVHRGEGIAHFLVDDGDRAARAVAEAGVGAATLREVVTTRLDQEVPGQLGALTRRLGEAGVNIEVQYSDHDGRLVLVVPEDQRRLALEVVSQA